MSNEEHILTEHGVKPTANRILILKTILEEERPLSMTEIETILETVDKSIISRTLATFREHHLLHDIEDGSDSVRYEVCHGHHHDGLCCDEGNDLHVHFHCEACGRTFCFEKTHIPIVNYPEGFQIHSINYMAKGLCPECSAKSGNNDK
ncbi:MAG: transcriptional repressor [Bacteroidales bacterium]|nr:transcriptional repressor [Bacteroidales bacterium]